MGPLIEAKLFKYSSVWICSFNWYLTQYCSTVPIAWAPGEEKNISTHESKLMHVLKSFVLLTLVYNSFLRNNTTKKWFFETWMSIFLQKDLSVKYPACFQLCPHWGIEPFIHLKRGTSMEVTITQKHCHGASLLLLLTVTGNCYLWVAEENTSTWEMQLTAQQPNLLCKL